jgi:hypothetical protein
MLKFDLKLKKLVPTVWYARAYHLCKKSYPLLTFGVKKIPIQKIDGDFFIDGFPYLTSSKLTSVTSSAASPAVGFP